MYKKEGNRGYEIYEPGKGYKTTMAPERVKESSRHGMNQAYDKETGPASEMTKSFKRTENQPLWNGRFPDGKMK
jgi:hypothetical protein